VAEGQVTLLRVLVNERRLTREEVRRCLVHRASRMQIDQFSIERRQLDRWLNGEVKRLPHPSACRVLEAEFGHPPEKLLSFVDADQAGSVATREPDTADLVTTAAAQSTAWGRRQESQRLGPLALEGLRIQVESLATAYVHRPMESVIRDLVALRNMLFDQLAEPDPAQTRELYLLAGVACAILGHASGNLGFLPAAHDQAQTALICAEKAGHPTLSAWAIGVRALQCEWNGRPQDTLSLVARAMRAVPAPSGASSTAVWLSAVEARAWARLGHREAATEALATAAQAASQQSGRAPDELDQIGGILHFPRPKQQYYAAVVSRRCEDLTRADQYARTAIAEYATGPAAARSYGDEALAWAELALSRTAARRPDLDGAAEALRGVHAASCHTRIAALAESLRELGAALSTPRLRTAPAAVRLREEIRHLLTAWTR
jgi:hypothetical protein